MATVYVTEPGTQVRKADERLRLVRGEEVLEEIPLIKVERLIMMGRGVNLTTAALFALIRQGADVVYLTGRGRFMARQVGDEHKNGKLRYSQARAVGEPRRALEIARSIVRGKIANQRTLVRRHAEGASWAQAALSGMDAMARRLDSARTLDELRGMEGQAAKEYFSLLRRLLRPPADGASWGFERRAYYPPTDPVNALLSFGYTLLLQDLIAACQMIGLDPYLGFFHAIDWGRPSMALDLEEEFRPVIVDSIVLAACNRPVVQLRDFEPAVRESDEEQPEPPDRPQAIYLKEAARAKYLALYEARVGEQAQYPAEGGERTAYRRMLALQAQHMAQVIMGQAPQYRPVEIR